MLGTRQKDLVSLLLTLQTKAYPEKSNVLEYSTPVVMRKTAQDLIFRLFKEDPEVDETSDEETALKDMQSGIMKMISQKTKPKESKLDKDFKLLESRGELSSRLEKLYTALLISETNFDDL